MSRDNNFPQNLKNVMLETDIVRKIANVELDSNQKVLLGQYLTPDSIASFMASMFPVEGANKVRLLDAGAGIGSLSSAFITMINEKYNHYEIIVDAYEIDTVMAQYLEKTMHRCLVKANENKNSLHWEIIMSDFISEASAIIYSRDTIWKKDQPRYTHCIMNPPYKKLSSASRHRKMLRSVGIETVNLYSAFMSLAIMLIEKGGYLVAIIPRSFCNGPYYRPFRELIMTRTAIKQIHLFDSRSKAFKDDHVLQESIIICLEVGGKQGKVKISTSTDDTFSNLKINDYSYNQIVMQDDRESIIHIPTSAEADQINESKNVKYCLEEIGLEVSTGPVVDFRMKEHLISLPEENSVPLIYPIHFNGYSFEWPIENAKKPNAIKNNERTLKWLYPNGFYTVVRRFSSKEEKSRIIARVINPEKIAEYNWIGIENHLNVFHRRKKPLDPLLANGIAVYLNSSAIDNHFRRFSGHTQVNATDLRFIKYPSRDLLIELGRWVIRQGQLTQEKIDTQVEKVIL